MTILHDVILWGVLLLVILMTLTAFAFLYLRVPFVPSDRHSLNVLLSANIFSGKERVCDLGSGNGKVLFFLARHYPTLQLTGYEIALLPFLYGKIKNCILRYPIRFNFRNFMQEDLSNYDIFFCYLTPHALHHVREKIEKYKKPFTLITNAFQLSDTFPDLTIAIPHSRQKIYIYHL